MLRSKRQQTATWLRQHCYLGPVVGRIRRFTFRTGRKRAVVHSPAVTLWAASSGDLRQLAQAKTGTDGTGLPHSARNNARSRLARVIEREDLSDASKRIRPMSDTIGRNPIRRREVLLHNTAMAAAGIVRPRYEFGLLETSSSHRRPYSSRGGLGDLMFWTNGTSPAAMA